MSWVRSVYDFVSMSSSGRDRGAEPLASGGSRPPSRGPERAAAILSAAVELIAERGYDAVTVDRIAARANASKATIYRHWPEGKAELVAEALRRAAEADGAALPDTGSLRGDLLAAVDGIVAAVTGADGGPSLLGLSGALVAHSDLRELVRRQIEAAARRTGKTIRGRASARGEVCGSAARFSLVMDVAVGQVLLATLLGGESPDRRARQRLVSQALLPLLRAS
jgi:AcrR family transcriptional regulator